MPEIHTDAVVRLRLGSTRVAVERVKISDGEGSTVWSSPFLVLDDGATRIELIPADGLTGFEVGMEIKALAVAMDNLWPRAR